MAYRVICSNEGGGLEEGQSPGVLQMHDVPEVRELVRKWLARLCGNDYVREWRRNLNPSGGAMLWMDPPEVATYWPPSPECPWGILWRRRAVSGTGRQPAHMTEFILLTEPDRALLAKKGLTPADVLGKGVTEEGRSLWYNQPRWTGPVRLLDAKADRIDLENLKVRKGLTWAELDASPLAPAKYARCFWLADKSREFGPEEMLSLMAESLRAIFFNKEHGNHPQDAWTRVSLTNFALAPDFTEGMPQLTWTGVWKNTRGHDDLLAKTVCDRLDLEDSKQIQEPSQGSLVKAGWAEELPVPLLARASAPTCSGSERAPEGSPFELVKRHPLLTGLGLVVLLLTGAIAGVLWKSRGLSSEGAWRSAAPELEVTGAPGLAASPAMVSPPETAQGKESRLRGEWQSLAVQVVEGRISRPAAKLASVKLTDEAQELPATPAENLGVLIGEELDARVGRWSLPVKGGSPEAAQLSRYREIASEWIVPEEVQNRLANIRVEMSQAATATAAPPAQAVSAPAAPVSSTVRLARCRVAVARADGGFLIPPAWIPLGPGQPGTLSLASLGAEALQAENLGKMVEEQSSLIQRFGDKLAHPGSGRPYGTVRGSSLRVDVAVGKDAALGRMLLLRQPGGGEGLLLLPEKGLRLEVNAAALLQPGGESLVGWLEPAEGTEVAVRFEGKVKEAPFAFEVKNRSGLASARKQLISEANSALIAWMAGQKAETAGAKLSPAEQFQAALQGFREHYHNANLLEGIQELEWVRTKKEGSDYVAFKGYTYVWELRAKKDGEGAFGTGPLGALGKECDRRSPSFSKWLKATGGASRARLIDAYIVYQARVCDALARATREDGESGMGEEVSRDYVTPPPKPCKYVAVVPVGVRARFVALAKERFVSRDNFDRVGDALRQLAAKLREHPAKDFGVQKANLEALRNNFAAAAEHIEELRPLALGEPGRSLLPAGEDWLTQLEAWTTARLKAEQAAQEPSSRTEEAGLSPETELEALLAGLEDEQVGPEVNRWVVATLIVRGVERGR